MVAGPRALDVRMNGVLVGRLAMERTGALSFIYDPDWLARPESRPISLSMPLTRQPYAGEIAYNYFDNLLPDNRQIRERIQARFGAATSHPFDLLSAAGRDCVGAIQLTPSGTSPGEVRQIVGQPMSEAHIAHLLGNYQSAPLGMERGEDDEDDFRISLAGAQEKTALLWHEGQWQRPVGATPTTHIFKLPIGRIEDRGIDLRDSCENEWLCLRIAKAFGFEVCEADIATFDGVKALVVKRFDRRHNPDGWIMRLPQEDMCQVMGVSPARKYEKDGGPGIVAIMDQLRGSEVQRQDRETFFKSQILFWLLAAIDGHAKNFSVFIQAGGRFRLTPLYDVMTAFPLTAARNLETRKLKMAMALIGKNRHYGWSEIQLRHFDSTARAAGFPAKRAAELLAEMLDRVDEAIAIVEGDLPAGFPEHVAAPTFQGMQELRRKYS